MRLLILAALPLIAAAPACPRGDLPPGFAAWSTPAPLASGEDAARAPALAIGRAARVALRPVTALRFARPPERAPGAGSRGGLIALAIVKPGRYTVALGTAAWIDLVRDGTALAATSHAHGPECAGIRKRVTFTLAPGRYLIQLSGATADATTLLVTPAL